MSHHSSESLNDFNEEFLKKFQNNPDAINELVFPFRGKPFGATGEFPAGKLNPQDEGAIQFGITIHEGKMIFNFREKPISWIGFTKDEVIDLIKYLNNKVSELR